MNKTFASTGLQEDILKALEELNFHTPSPIQAEAIPFILEKDDDLIALAQTGTGKTAAFSLPVIQKIDPTRSHVQALILSPTRELAIQIAKDIEAFSKHKRLKVVTIYGGARADQQIRKLRDGAQVVVATPGRAVDLIQRKALQLDQVQWLVLDEADEMLNMGFKDDLDTILATTPRTRQTLLFSATMLPDIERIAKDYMNTTHRISVGKRNEGASSVEHVFFVAHARDRYEALRRIIDAHPEMYGIIFTRTKRESQEVADRLIADRYAAEALNGDMEQRQRDYVMERFRKKKIQFLVATDVAARGIDVDSLTHVINYNIPDQLEAYVHRSGRTGRANNKGVSMVIINMREHGVIRRLEKMIGRSFSQEKIPTGKEICAKQLSMVADKVRNGIDAEPAVQKHLPDVQEQLKDMTKEDLIAYIVGNEWGHFLEKYKFADDINVEGRMPRGRESRGSGNMSTFQVNLGREHEFTKPHLFEMLNSSKELRGIAVGRIDVRGGMTTFEVDTAHSGNLPAILGKLQYRGIPIVAQSAEFSGGGRSGGRGRRRSGGGGRGGNRRYGGGGFGQGRRSGGRPQGGRNNRRGGGYPTRPGGAPDDL